MISTSSPSPPIRNGTGNGHRVEGGGGGGGYVKFGRFRGVPMAFLLICSISTTTKERERGGEREGKGPKSKSGQEGKTERNETKNLIKMS